MPSNIEIKARVTDWDNLRERVEGLSDTECEILIQEDTFFKVDTGRLKLRIFPGNVSDLIYYQRSDTADAKQSEYQIYRSENAEELLHVLNTALGTLRVVKKTRYLYLIGQTRAHLDDVEGLGKFLELEVVLGSDQDPNVGHMIMKKLMGLLGIQPDQLIECAYADLLAARNE